MPLIELVPPSVLPRGHCNRRPPVPGSASLKKFQLILGIVEDAQDAGRDMDHRVAVGRPGFEQDDPRAVLAQPAGDDAAGRPGANDHIIRFHRANHDIIRFHRALTRNSHTGLYTCPPRSTQTRRAARPNWDSTSPAAPSRPSIEASNIRLPGSGTGSYQAKGDRLRKIPGRIAEIRSAISQDIEPGQIDRGQVFPLAGRNGRILNVGRCRQGQPIAAIAGRGVVEVSEIGHAAVDREIGRVVVAETEHARGFVAEQIEYRAEGRGRVVDSADAAERFVELMRRDSLEIIGARRHSVRRIEGVAGGLPANPIEPSIEACVGEISPSTFASDEGTTYWLPGRRVAGRCATAMARAVFDGLLSDALVSHDFT